MFAGDWRFRWSGVVMLPVIAAVAWAMAGAAPGSGGAAAERGMRQPAGWQDTPAGQAPAITGADIAADLGAFVATVSSTSTSARQGMAEFSSASGRVLRWLLVSKSRPGPVAVSGRWVYYLTQTQLSHAFCAHNGVTEPTLWRVSVSGGRPQRTRFHSTSLAFSPDGRMAAYISTGHCGHTLWVVVRNQRTGAARRIFLAHNTTFSQAPTLTAQLSWAPDDVRLAVAVAPAPAIMGLSVVDSRHATNLSTAPDIRPCAVDTATVTVGCYDPGFDIHGRLTFLKWRSTLSSFTAWATRWYHGHATALFRLSHEQNNGGPVSLPVNRSGSAVLLESYLTNPAIWRWSQGFEALIVRSTQQRTVTSPLWLR